MRDKMFLQSYNIIDSIDIAKVCNIGGILCQKCKGIVSWIFHKKHSGLFCLTLFHFDGVGDKIISPFSFIFTYVLQDISCLDSKSVHSSPNTWLFRFYRHLKVGYQS